MLKRLTQSYDRKKTVVRARKALPSWKMEDVTKKTFLLNSEYWVEDPRGKGTFHMQETKCAKAAVYRFPNCTNYVSGNHPFQTHNYPLIQAFYTHHRTTAKPPLPPPIPSTYDCLKYRLMILFSLLWINNAVLQVLSHVRLYNPMDYSPPGSSVRGISQARILAWAAISLSRGSSQLRDQTWVSRTSWISSLILHLWATREAPK